MTSRHRSWSDARRAPSARLASFAQTRSGSTAAWPTQVPKPQSDPGDGSGQSSCKTKPARATVSYSCRMASAMAKRYASWRP